MISLQQISIDRDGFAANWLNLVKQHCRVEFDRDDEYLLSVINRAASQVERVTGQEIVPAEYVFRPHAWHWTSSDRIRTYASLWAPFGSYTGLGGYLWSETGASRIRSIRSFRAMYGIDGALEDRSPIWRILGDLTPGAVTPRFLCRASLTSSSTNWTESVAGARWSFFVRTGFAKPEATPPGLADAILRLSGHFYENRELMVGNGQIAPDFLEQGLGTLWVPRC